MVPRVSSSWIVFGSVLLLGCGEDSSGTGSSADSGTGGSSLSDAPWSDTGTGGVATDASTSDGASGAAGSGGSSGAGGSTGSGGTGADAGDPSFTADGCFKWKGAQASQLSLQDAVSQHACVEVQAGTYTLNGSVAMKPGHVLRGVSAAESILVASQTNWKFGCCDAMVSDSLPADPAANPFKVQKLTLDGAGVATYNVCCRGYLVQGTVMKRSRCSAIGIAGTGVTAKSNQMLESAQPTSVPGKGTVTCATGGFGGVAEGAAIYSEGKAETYSSLIEDNTIQGTNGPALDINGAWGGVFRGNVVSGNSAWAAVSLYGASNWVIENNQISHPAGEPPQPYHPYCATGPSGGHSAGIFLCQDTDANNVVTTGNKIVGNKTSSFYGILSVGADELKPYWAPRNNTFQNNDVFGSNHGCADDFKIGQWQSDQNVWTGNNCAGTPGSSPTYF